MMDEQGLKKQLRAMYELFNALGDTAVLVDSSGIIHAINEAGANRFDLTVQDIIGLGINDILEEDAAGDVRKLINDVFASGRVIQEERHYEGKDCDIILYPVFDDEGEVKRVAIYSRDITSRKQIQDALEASEERFRNAFEYAAIGMAEVSLNGEFLKVNKSLCDMLGYTEQEICSLSYQEVTHPEDIQAGIDRVRQLLKGEIKSFRLEKRYLHKDGYPVWVWLTGTLIRDKQGKPLHLLGQIQNVDHYKKTVGELNEAKEEAEKARAHAEHLASIDYLTGLWNRRAFMNRLEIEFQYVKTHDVPLNIILADIDRFKKVNDNFGHQLGDIVLQKFAHVLVSNCRNEDFLGRYGGEEFIICLPGVDNEQAVKIAERLRTEVQDHKFLLNDGTYKYLHITASFGLAFFKREVDKNIDILIERADEALYRAKAEGRNRVCVG